MSFLDRITGLAQKAKENVVSKTFISKDKRLEQSLSDSIRVNDLFFEKMSTYGLPSTINVITFDCVAGLLAVAGDSNQGHIKVFGKGISTTIKLPKPIGIKYLQFKTGFPILVVIDKSNNIITLDLRTKSIRHALAAPEIITSQCYCTGTDWLFVGYANGYVDVFDIMQGTFTPYQIPDLLETQESNIPFEGDDMNKKHIVVDLQMHPTELNTLLIGYEAAAFIWNIRENTIRRSFSLRRLDKSNQYRNAMLTCLAWSPNGARFIGGYDDGCTHVWDVKNEQKPISSRKLSQAFATPTHDGQIPMSEPIYQVAWYVDEASHKSCIIIAGGSNATDIQGLNLLEYDLDSEAREPKKQTILPLPSDLSHFVILSTNPYHSGMFNPFGIGVIGADHSVKTFSLEHGYPSLKLPPAFDFIGPNVINACHIPQLPESAFKKLTTITSMDRKTRYLPITGGIAGPDHVYHVDSRDILLTIHQGEVVKFWDASYTALRPLSHLTIHCMEDIDKDAFLCCLDVNKNNGVLSIGFSDGSIVIYECHVEKVEESRPDPRLMTKNEEFINSCDDTLKEISDLLQDMEVEPEEVVEHTEAEGKNPFITTTPPAEHTNPFVEPSPTHQKLSSSSTPSEHQSPETPSVQSNRKSKHFKVLDKFTDAPGFFACLKISLDSPVQSIVSISDSILAVATDNGKVVLVDIHRQMILFSHNIAQSDYHNTVVIPAFNLKSDIANGLKEADTNEEPTKPPSITTLNFFHTYSPTKVMTPTTQLFVGLSNGHVYQFPLALLIERGPSIASTEMMNEYLSLRVIPNTILLDMHVVDIQGVTHQTSVIEVEAPLSKTVSHHSTESGDDELSPKPSSVISNSSATSNSPSKRMAAIGKAEYRHQDNPHFIVCISSTSINTVLSGFNVKLFSKEFKDFTVVRGEIVKSHDGVCLCLVTSHGKLGFYSLPTLDLMLEMNLPNRCLLDRLGETSISQDGRIVIWTGQYEMEQYSFTPKPDFQIGESVILFDSQKSIPPHPSLIQQQQQKPKKSWLDTVAGAFTREPLTLPQLDLLMGRVPEENPNVVRQQKIDAYKAKHHEPSASSSGPGGVFSQLGEKMNERGDKINQLDKKFEEMNAASGDFLKAVKEYNARQERKKWWEF